MNTCLKSSFSALTLALTVAGCSTAPFWQPPPASKAPVAKAPIVERNARRPPGYPAQPSSSYPQTEARPLPQDDPLLPREYSSTYPSSDPDAAPARPYSQSSEGGTYRQPTYPRTGNNTTQPPTYPRTGGNTTQPPAYPYAGNTTQPPAYPPGAAASQPYYPTVPADDDGYGRPSASAYPAAPQSTDTRYGAAPTPGSLPEPQPVVPRVPSTAPRPSTARPPAPEHTAVATAPPAAAVEPAPAPVQPTTPRPPTPPPPPVDLPPAEITREGNQAVVALLESADKSVKSNQLDKAGAALERALRIEPRNAGIWHDLAQIRLHQGQYQQAESLASKSANLASGNRALQARNWKVIAAARKAAGNMAGAEEAEARAAQFAR